MKTFTERRICSQEVRGLGCASCAHSRAADHDEELVCTKTAETVTFAHICDEFLHEYV